MTTPQIAEMLLEIVVGVTHSCLIAEGRTAEMAQLSWFCLLMIASSLEFSSSKWWSPYQWRNYWQDWWETSEKGQTQPQQNKHEILTNGEG